MPTYEYECDACAHTFEELQSFSDAPLTECPRCGKKQLRRLFGTGAAVIFKGSGFYETDYRSDSYKKAAKSEQESSSKPNSTDTSGSTSKSEPASGTAGTEKTTAPGKSSKSET